MDESEVRKNYEAFKQRLPSILAAHQGKIALMHKGEIVAFFDTIADANTAGQKLFENKPFSLQEVTDLPIDLGFFSHASLSQRTV